MEISMELGTNLKASEEPIVCKLSDSPFRILRVGYGSFVQLFHTWGDMTLARRDKVYSYVHCMFEKMKLYETIDWALVYLQIYLRILCIVEHVSVFPFVSITLDPNIR